MSTIPVYKTVEKFREKLKTGAFGPFMITSDPAFVEASGYAGFDFVIIDMEHGPISYETLQGMIRAANVADIMPVVRVPRGMDIWIDKALDVGAGAVLIPQIDNGEQAKAAVAAAKFNPKGNRGVNRFVRAANYSSVSGNEYFGTANDTMVILQAEGKKAIENLDDILAVGGFDVLFIGPYDLSGSLGLIGQIDHPLVLAEIDKIIEKAAKVGVAVGIFADNATNAKKWKDRGVNFISYSCDMELYLRSAVADVNIFNGK